VVIQPLEYTDDSTAITSTLRQRVSDAGQCGGVGIQYRQDASIGEAEASAAFTNNILKGSRALKPGRYLFFRARSRVAKRMPIPPGNHWTARIRSFGYMDEIRPVTSLMKLVGNCPQAITAFLGAQMIMKMPIRKTISRL